jgi:hypothetical protein|tara:strand:+ start:324 stop:599 length:276 start_codon:yes stop_codon:yes gene_type:complete
MIIGDSKQVAVTFQSGAKILSLSLDNSLGRMETLRRGDVRLMIEGEDGNRDVTDQVFEEAADGHAVHASMGNFEIAMNWLRRVQWGMGESS